MLMAASRHGDYQGQTGMTVSGALTDFLQQIIEGGRKGRHRSTIIHLAWKSAV